eukprot:Blabericola_migrator_1__11602@NODE_696_length_6829_cov_299_117421_g505_i0_p5_GENE_NODE_696_length_6829_cov_299_117421_g505_i0NODE_696_length_6829_cov_299_117421_g505_i0_p5_ORF_typecomplete_len114_score2_85_NODE_696_length_6829_cov_299_117421_g505_i035593900
MVTKVPTNRVSIEPWKGRCEKYFCFSDKFLSCPRIILMPCTEQRRPHQAFFFTAPSKAIVYVFSLLPSLYTSYSPSCERDWSGTQRMTSVWTDVSGPRRTCMQTNIPHSLQTR